MGEQKEQLSLTKVDQLRPGAIGVDLIVKVMSSKAIMTRGGRNGNQGSNMRISECLVGDESGIIIFTARNDQVNVMKEGNTVTLKNAKIDMYKGSMRLGVDRWGRLEVTSPSYDISIKENNNLSLIEFELITVEE